MTVTISNPNFRPGTQTEMREVVFDMKMPMAKTAAIGDMICWMPAIKFIAENYNFVAGHLIVPQWFIELAAEVLKAYPHWRLHSSIPDRLAEGFPLKQPLQHPVNATAMHLIDLGFIYFCGINPPPEGSRVYPLLSLEDVELRGEKIISGPYAVMTPGATAVNRAMLPSVYNAICDHLLAKGITPVHLGVTEMKNRLLQPHFDDRYNLDKGINLIDKTTLLQAAKIMDEATMVIGIDNGLLHLAAMTDVTILIGYTMAGPVTRRLYRSHGETVELYGDKKRVPCLFCQEHVRFFIDHHFTNCIYKESEPLCVKALNTESWIATIDQVLKGNQ